ncbi:hypothetical protein CIPAW_03G163300 [Carya illinoinensis]|uniref:CCT domain-containing protein n=1 Tax=Carya illinoinensis TaxID=32201 RepID=A0A8T1R316_CARIL|nr:hypothetical protein CIPAW_03G163300 [Carya illinoinensis]KAG6661286.1 hypothetical protein CIPAW_03G163300 [Carya illinoinensis]
MELSSVIQPNPNSMPRCRDQAPLFPEESSLPKDASDFKDLGIHDGNDLYEGLNMDDVPLTLKNGEIFGCPQGTTIYQFEDGGMECQSMEKNLSVTESNGPIESTLEASSSGQQNCVAFQSSHLGGSTSVMQSINVFLTVESPWESNLEASCPQAREKAKMRYNEKKKSRSFGKQIRYASRKARADTRKRVRGRFVKAGEAYDYDPLVTGNF